jgi:protein TonB
MKPSNPNTTALAFAHAEHLPIVGAMHPLRAQYRSLLYRALGFALFFHLAVFSAFSIASLARTVAPPERTVVIHLDRLPPPPPIDPGKPTRPPLERLVATPPAFARPEPVPNYRADDVVFGGPEDLPWEPFDPGADGTEDASFVFDVPPAATEKDPLPTDFEAYEEAPVFISMPAPSYPEMARQAGVEGTVMVRALVGKDGKIHEALVVSSIPMLDEAALDAARGAIFKPALQQHKPVAVWVQIPMRFTLH